ncbi:hypothetical protein SY27_08825 [Flavobacterium sp. 316]|uniref:hypothetical protein n=1 Tax=Flavobacterium sp. 316 TaxID=1603293 RepID=UPI0005E342CC|nr:hypothetical protein [Flavobacterium sp. 316]KIX21769.1 hypothetical protein SY27_08825 [Flavobacterium sp. 316]
MNVYLCFEAIIKFINRINYGKFYDKNFKITIAELLKSGRLVKDISQESRLNDSILQRQLREFNSKAEDFTKKIELSIIEITQQ